MTRRPPRSTLFPTRRSSDLMRRVSHRYWLIPIVLAAFAVGLAACGTAPNQTSQTAGGTIEIHRSEEHTSELQSRPHLVCRLPLEKKNKVTTRLRYHNATGVM